MPRPLPSLAPALLGLSFALSACSCSGHRASEGGEGASPGRATGRGEARGGLARVANNDPSGADDQPDWDDLARQTREMVEPRLPHPLPDRGPEDRAAACEGMLDAAIAFHTQIEREPLHRAARREELLATREADLAACTTQTSVAAATCVTLLLGDRNGELPWLLDQCTRAFP